jgi:hypothetical protein
MQLINVFYFVPSSSDDTRDVGDVLRTALMGIIVFPKEGQLAERYAKKHSLRLRQIGQSYALRCLIFVLESRRSEALRVTVSKFRFEFHRFEAAFTRYAIRRREPRYALRGLCLRILR